MFSGRRHVSTLRGQRKFSFNDDGPKFDSSAPFMNRYRYALYGLCACQWQHVQVYVSRHGIGRSGQVRSGQVGQLRPTARRFRSQGGLWLARRCSTQGRCEWAARARAGTYGRGACLLREGHGRTVPAGCGWKPGLGHRPGLGFKFLPPSRLSELW